MTRVVWVVFGKVSDAFAGLESVFWGAWSALSVEGVELFTVRVLAHTDVVVIKVEPVVIVTALAFSLAIPAVTFRVLPSWDTFPVFDFVVFPTGCTRTVLTLLFTVQVDDRILFNRNTLAINNLVIFNAWCTFSIQLAVLFAVLWNYNADSMVIEEVTLFTFDTFSWTALTCSCFTEWVFSCWNTFSLL